MKKDGVKTIRNITPEEREWARRKIKSESSLKTICQLIRDLYISAEERGDYYDSSRAMNAYIYAKRMNSALRRQPHNEGYDARWWWQEFDEQYEEVPFTTC